MQKVCITNFKAKNCIELEFQTLNAKKKMIRSDLNLKNKFKKKTELKTQCDSFRFVQSNSAAFAKKRKLSTR